MSYKTVEAIWENGEIKWINGSLPPKKCKLIVLYEEEQITPKQNIEVFFENLAKIKTFREIEDPVEWQREIRKSWDRLPDLSSQTN